MSILRLRKPEKGRNLHLNAKGETERERTKVDARDADGKVFRRYIL